MTVTTRLRAQLVMGLATLVALAWPHTVHGAGAVGNGTPASCTDAALNSALSGGGLVTFNCGPAPVTIDISPGAGGTGTKAIATDTTIDGGSLITISGGNSVGVFSVNTGVNFTVQNLTIANGNSASDGGAIYNEGAALALQDCTLSGNSARSGGGIYNKDGTLSVQGCTLSGNSADYGGAIYNVGNSTLTLTNCAVSGNSAGNRGAGIYNYGNSTLTNCTLSGNTATVYGGGIHNEGTLTLTNTTLSGNSVVGGDIHYGLGGAIDNGGTMMLTSCTLSGNSAASLGGAINNRGEGTLTNCTISGNSAAYSAGGIYAEPGFGRLTLINCTVSANAGGGIVNDGTVTAVNTILAAGQGAPICARAPLVSNGHNLDEDGSCGLSNTGDQAGVPANLARLGDYGGPTQTIALCTGRGMPDSPCGTASLAIDAADNAYCPTTDERGAPRPFGAACDIGAYESGAQPPTSIACVGDCDGGGDVTVDELITLVNIAVGTADAAACPHGIPSGVTVDITVIIQAVNVALIGCALSPAEQGCLNSGGTVASAMCCAGTDDFPDTCAVGACGCSPDASHEVRVCTCGAESCFDGIECVRP